MKNFFDILTEKTDDKQCGLCVGLSPDFEKIPEELKEKFKSSGAVLFIFNKAIIDAVYDIVPAVALDFSKYMRYGIGGMVSFKSTVDYAKKKGLAVITVSGTAGDGADAAKAFLKAPTEDLPEQLRDGAFDTDAVTIDIYGKCGNTDANEIFNAVFENSDSEKGIFVTYEDGAIANNELVKNILNYSCENGEAGYSKIGIYVKSGDGKTVRKVKSLLNNTFILCENTGNAADVFDENGHGGLILCPETVMYAYKIKKWAEKFGEKGFAEAARNEAYAIINSII